MVVVAEDLLLVPAGEMAEDVVGGKAAAGEGGGVDFSDDDGFIAGDGA